MRQAHTTALLVLGVGMHGVSAAVLSPDGAVTARDASRRVQSTSQRLCVTAG